MSDLNTSKEQALETERYELLQQLEDWLETPMLVLGFAWLVLLLIELIWGLSPLSETIGMVIWIVFIADFAIKFTLAPKKVTYLKSNWLTAIALVIPALRVFSHPACGALAAGNTSRTWTPTSTCCHVA